MALNYLDGKNLCDCDTDKHALLVASSGGQCAEVFITDDDHLSFWWLLQMNMGVICKAFSVGRVFIIKHVFAKFRIVY